MRRREFLTKTLEGIALLSSGLILNNDGQQNEGIEAISSTNDRRINTLESAYRSTREKLTDSGLEIIERYSREIESERIVIFLPDMHHPVFINDQRKRIKQVVNLFKDKPIIVGLEGYYQELTAQFIQNAKVRKETFVESNKEETVLKAKVTEIGNSFVKLIKEDLQRKNIIKLLAEFEDISKHVLTTVRQNKGYENQIHSPGSAYLFEDYPKNIHLFGIESENIYKECMQKYAEYDNTLKMQYVEILRIKTAEMIAKYKIDKNDRRIKDILSITDVLESMISESCSKFQRCVEYRNSRDKSNFSINVRDMKQMFLELDLKRNKTWSERIKALDRRYNIAIVIGGVKHIETGLYQEITRDSSMITIDTHIQSYNPKF
ncbi:hypothetical protein HZA96_07260 [Candidatus Woesearchaeota archaeon]|nr:hypothetical protein [Candidatus Woesearchaeota archaeon]